MTIIGENWKEKEDQRKKEQSIHQKRVKADGEFKVAKEKWVEEQKAKQLIEIKKLHKREPTHKKAINQKVHFITWLLPRVKVIMWTLFFIAAAYFFYLSNLDAGLIMGIIWVCGSLHAITFVNPLFNYINKREAKYKYCEHNIIGGIFKDCSGCLEKNEIREELREKENEIKNKNKKHIQKAGKYFYNEVERVNKKMWQTVEFIKELDGIEFEHYVAQVFSKNGYETKVTPASSDMGKDIIMTKDGDKYIVECKHYSVGNSVGRPALQKFYAAMVEEKAKGIFVITSEYTQPAIEYAQKMDIQLMDQSDLLEIISIDHMNEISDNNTISIMCLMCDDLVEFYLKDDSDLIKNCKNNHKVSNYYYPREFVDTGKWMAVKIRRRRNDEGAELFCEKCHRPKGYEFSEKHKDHYRSNGLFFCSCFTRNRRSINSIILPHNTDSIL